MFTLSNLLVNLLWVFGLAGIVATFGYMSWYRSTRGWRWKTVFSLPRMLIPLSVSLELFSMGLAISGVVAPIPAPWWETAAWSILALLFAIQTVGYGLAGLRHGWDTPLEGKDNP